MVWLFFSPLDLPIFIIIQFKIVVCVQGCPSIAQLSGECTVNMKESVVTVCM